MLSLPPDGSFVFQVLAFFVFWFVMKRLLFDAVQGVIEAREKRLEELLAQARDTESKARRIEEKSEAELAEARAEAVRESDEIRRLAEVEERAIIERARSQAAETIARAREEIGRQAVAALGEVGERARDLASTVAATIMGRPV